MEIYGDLFSKNIIFKKQIYPFMIKQILYTDIICEVYSIFVSLHSISPATCITSTFVHLLLNAHTYYVTSRDAYLT